MRILFSLLLIFSASAASAADHKLLHDVAGEVQPDALRATDAKLVGFGTRHTLSDATSPTRGIGAARNYVKQRFEAIATACGGCLTIAMPFETVSGDRVPAPTAIYDILAIQKGVSDPNRVVIIAAHVDSRNSDPMNATRDAPGADDDASGTSAVLEAARILSKRKFPATLVYAMLTGEEQGLFGGKVLANYARAHGWQVEADLNNDIIGNSHGSATAMVMTVWSMTAMCACCRKAPARWRRRRKAASAAAMAASWTVRHATWRASSPDWRTPISTISRRA